MVSKLVLVYIGLAIGYGAFAHPEYAILWGALGGIIVGILINSEGNSDGQK